MKLIKSLLLLPAMLFAVSANAIVITDIKHTLNLSPTVGFENPFDSIFSVLPMTPFDDPNEINIGLFTNLSTTTVEVTEVASGDGTVTRTESELSLSFTRELLSFAVDSVVGLFGFNPVTDVTLAGNRITLDLSNATVADDSALIFSSSIELIETDRQLLSQESTLIRTADINPTESTSVPVPPLASLLLLGLVGIAMRKHFRVG